MWVFLFQPRRGYISCGGFFLDPNEIFFSAGCTFHPRRGLKPRQGGHRVPTRCETSARWPRGHPKWPRVDARTPTHITYTHAKHTWCVRSIDLPRQLFFTHRVREGRLVVLFTLKLVPWGKKTKCVVWYLAGSSFPQRGI